MTLMSDTPTRRRLHAPRGDGQVILDPPASEVARVFAENKSTTERYNLDFQGRSYGSLADLARRQLISLARNYTSAYRDTDVVVDSDTILVAGHQPELFHAGVWFKNFALDHFGKRLGACPINLLVDNDAIRSTTLKVPTGSVQLPRVEHIQFDAPGEELPFEERKVIDPELLKSFDRRVADAMAPLVEGPLLDLLWRPVEKTLGHTNNLGQCLAQLRHRFEQNIGLQTLEVPLSDVCRGEPFYWFMSHLLANLPRLWGTYNDSLREYRRVNRIRSRTHPVADLAEQDGWLEAPFWIWSNEDPRRRRLFIRSNGEQIELTDRAGLRLPVSLSSERDADRAIEQFAELSNRGVRLRPRALITTIYARLMLGDLFLHGIGGAKYDELTDVIIRRFFAVEPPRYMTLSATMMLPIDRTKVGESDLTDIDQQLRELVFHPEKHLGDEQRVDQKVTFFVTEKQRRIAEHLPRGQRFERHQAICNANLELQPFVEEKRKKLLSERSIVEQNLKNNNVLASREFGFCLFPEESLVPRLLELFAPGP